MRSPPWTIESPLSSPPSDWFLSTVHYQPLWSHLAAPGAVPVLPWGYQPGSNQRPQLITAAWRSRARGAEHPKITPGISHRAPMKSCFAAPLGIHRGARDLRWPVVTMVEPIWWPMVKQVELWAICWWNKWWLNRFGWTGDETGS